MKTDNSKKTPNKSEPAIDMDFLRDVTGGDTDFEKELFVLFIDSSKGNITKLEKALSEKNEDAWYAASHSLKGASASIGAFSMAEIVEYAQTHPKDDDKKKASVLSEIKSEFAKVAEFIDKLIKS